MSKRVPKPRPGQFKLLGKSGVSAPTALLEVFETPASISHVIMRSDEVTAVCPVTGQPDQYTVEIRYTPDKFCIESKSLKLKLQSYRNVGMFCEALAANILKHVVESISPKAAAVEITQKSRGGVAIIATADYLEGD